jgi:beta-galactosidase
MYPDRSSLLIAVPARPPAPEVGYLNLGQYQHPSRTLTVNSHHLELDKRPWLPVMGEFHYSRCPSDEWPSELAQVRAGGVQVVASYVIWNHHEPFEGAWRWDGQRDLARFVTEAARAGLLVYLRPGPWVHAEVRLGGFPQWLGGATRCNDEAYLRRVARWFDQVARQLRGLLWHEGGPVIGIQLENEYGGTGPGRGAEHIAALKRLAIDAGLRVPLYTVTGWPTLDIPAREVLPVSGAYADGFWQGARGPLPPSGVFLFNTQRVIGEMGNVDGTPPTATIDPDRYPFCLAEAGGGMHQSYHRRPVVTPDDVYSTALVQIGSGANLYGYYMYHGGTNPVCETGPLNESQATGYPNDVPEWGYDFHAPLGQYGQVRPSWGRQRLLHTFCAAFGHELALLGADLPDDAPRDPADLTRPRVAARVAGGDASSVHGFVFVNHHVRHHPLPRLQGQRIGLALSGGEALTLPHAGPFDLQPGMAFIWPVGQRLGAARMAQATVQPFTRWSTEAGVTWVGLAIPGLPVELLFDRAGVQTLEAPGAEIEAVGEQCRIRLDVNLTPVAMFVVDTAGARHVVLLLPQSWAERCAHVQLAGRDRLLLASHPARWDERTQHVRLARPLHEHGFVRLYPADGLTGSREHLGVYWAGWHWPEARHAKNGPWALDTRQHRAAAEPHAVRWGPHVPWRDGPVPTVPGPEAWATAAAWTLRIPDGVPPCERLWLSLDLVCDVARFKVDGRVVDDRFGDGTPWVIGLHRWPRSARFELELLPLREDAPIFLEPGARAAGALLRSATLAAECSHTVNIVPEA